jgi:hypothetical protein
MGGIDEGANVQHQNTVTVTQSVRQVVGQDAAAHTGPDDNEVKVFINAVIISDQAGMGLVFLCYQIYVVILKWHLCSP